MKKSLKFWNMLPWLLIIAGGSLLIFRVLISRYKGQTTTGGPIVDIDEQPPIDDEPEPSKEQRIVNHFKLIRSVLPASWDDDTAKMVAAQAMHETGIYTSRLYKEQNNLFGMRHPQIRETLSTREQSGYATYASLEDSVRDLLLYFKEFKEGTKYTKINDYVKMLKQNGYFTANYIDYFNPVRSHYNKVKELVQ